GLFKTRQKTHVLPLQTWSTRGAPAPTPVLFCAICPAILQTQEWLPVSFSPSYPTIRQIKRVSACLTCPCNLGQFIITGPICLDLPSDFSHPSSMDHARFCKCLFHRRTIPEVDNCPKARAHKDLVGEGLTGRGRGWQI